jgi:hypothetical protein
MTQDVAREAERGHLEAPFLSHMGLGIGIEPAVRGLGGHDALQMCGKRRRLRPMSLLREISAMAGEEAEKREGDERHVERWRRAVC